MAQRHLRPPSPGALHLISPPGSPPLGWTPVPEAGPNTQCLSNDLEDHLRIIQMQQESGKGLEDQMTGLCLCEGYKGTQESTEWYHPVHGTKSSNIPHTPMPPIHPNHQLDHRPTTPPKPNLKLRTKMRPATVRNTLDTVISPISSIPPTALDSTLVLPSCGALQGQNESSEKACDVNVLHLNQIPGVTNTSSSFVTSMGLSTSQSQHCHHQTHAPQSYPHTCHHANNHYTHPSQTGVQSVGSFGSMTGMGSMGTPFHPHAVLFGESARNDVRVLEFGNEMPRVLIEDRG